MSDASSPRFRLAYVTYGDVDDPMIASGVPHYLRRGFDAVDDVQVTEVSARSSRWTRLLIKLLSFRPNRVDWERNYLHGTLLPRARSWARSRGVLKAQPVDAVLHVRTWYSALPSTPYASFIDATVAMVRGYDVTWDLSERQYRNEIRVEGDFYRRAAVVYTASHAAIDSLVNDYGVDRSRIVRVGAGTTLPRIPELTADMVARRYADPTILFVGKDPDRKGLPELIEAFQIARERHPGLRLTIVGPAEHRPEYDQPGIEWLGLVNDKQRLSELYTQSSLLCLAAYRESFGLVIPEAMAHGLPCIVSDVAELPHLVDDGVTGAVVPEITPAAIATGIARLLDGPEQYAALARAAFESSAAYDWTAIAKVMAQDLRARTGHGEGVKTHGSH